MNDYKIYKKILKKSLNEAKKGEGHVSPNPLVGAAIIDDDFNILSLGYHEQIGSAHAEVNAIKNCKAPLSGKTIVVTLEPCCHQGKTPPCTDLIIKSGIKKVVVGMVDPCPLVAGKGIKKLRDSGIEVIENILVDECTKLNEIFIKNQISKMPFVAIKTATTLDGKIAAKNGDSKWITNENSRKLVHKLRNKYDAILTSSSTVVADNPSMTARLNNTRNPKRVILDKNLRTNPSSKIFLANTSDIFVVTSNTMQESDFAKYPSHIKFIKAPLKNDEIDLSFVVKELFNQGIYSVLVEAGGKLNNSFIQEKLVDKIYQFVAPKLLADKDAINWVYGNDLDSISKSISFEIASTKKIGSDLLLELYPLR